MFKKGQFSLWGSDGPCCKDLAETVRWRLRQVIYGGNTLDSKIHDPGTLKLRPIFLYKLTIRIALPAEMELNSKPSDRRSAPGIWLNGRKRACSMDLTGVDREIRAA